MADTRSTGSSSRNGDCEAYLYVGRISYPVTTLGPGRRIGLWLEGCSIGCPGCISPELLVRREESRSPVSRVLERIVSLSAGHEGLTVSGGEPFDQAVALGVLLAGVRGATGLDILVYTGYTIEALRAGPPPYRELLDRVDVLIDGPFRRELANRRLWRGSDNQRMHLLTPRAGAYGPFQDAVYGDERELQFELTEGGGLLVIGIPERGFERELPRIARRFGVTVSKTKERT
jgi:anaerobic ribonucleoside-triphosphate reductase activating protein